MNEPIHPEIGSPVEGMGTPADESQTSTVQRETPRPELSRTALLNVWSDRVRRARSHWSYAFTRMREDMRFVRGYQWPQQTRDNPEERYVANLTLRHVAQKVAALYAKNPKAVAHRRTTLDFQTWDGSTDSLMQAQQTLQQAMQMGPEGAMHPAVQQAQDLLMDVSEGMQRKTLYEKMGKTLELVYEHQIQEQNPPTKKAMKKLVRRTVTTGVGYVKLGYHRQFERSPEDQDRINDVAEQLSMLDNLVADAQDKELREDESRREELQILLQNLQGKEELVVREGLSLDYPPSASIIPDPACRNLDGFVGCRWVAQEFLLTPQVVQEIYGKDVGSTFVRYNAEYHDTGVVTKPAEEQPELTENDMVCVWEIYDKRTRTVYVIADGYPDFLEEPHEPTVVLERFWPFFTLMFNEVEDEYDIFPPSDVSLIRDMQIEYNIARQRLREHRDANRPKYVSAKGQLDEQDKSALTSSDAHTVVEMNGLQPGQKISDVLQGVPHSGIDPNLYEVGTYFEDILKVGGSQEANIGGAAGVTATEASIGESSRMTGIGSNIDDLDDFLTELARSASQVLLLEMSPETAQEIAGPGAVWPELTAQEVARELWLEVSAGSSGRPNKAQEIQNFERLAPFLLQIPNLNPRWLLNQAVERLDDRMDLDEAFAAGLPSIVAQNGQSQPGTGDPSTDPNAQGPQGAANQPGVMEGDSNMGPNNAAVGPPDESGRPTPAARGTAPPIQMARAG